MCGHSAAAHNGRIIVVDQAVKIFRFSNSKYCPEARALGITFALHQTINV